MSKVPRHAEVSVIIGTSNVKQRSTISHRALYLSQGTQNRIIHLNVKCAMRWMWERRGSRLISFVSAAGVRPLKSQICRLCLTTEMGQAGEESKCDATRI